MYTRYLKGPPGSGIHNGNKIMAIQLTDPLLLMKTLIPHLKCWIWKSLLYMYLNSLLTKTEASIVANTKIALESNIIKS